MAAEDDVMEETPQQVEAPVVQQSQPVSQRQAQPVSKRQAKAKPVSKPVAQRQTKPVSQAPVVQAPVVQQSQPVSQTQTQAVAYESYQEQQPINTNKQSVGYNAYQDQQWGMDQFGQESWEINEDEPVQNQWGAEPAEEVDQWIPEAQPAPIQAPVQKAYKAPVQQSYQAPRKQAMTQTLVDNYDEEKDQDDHVPVASKAQRPQREPKVPRNKKPKVVMGVSKTSGTDSGWSKVKGTGMFKQQRKVKAAAPTRKPTPKGPKGQRKNQSKQQQPARKPPMKSKRIANASPKMQAVKHSPKMQAVKHSPKMQAVKHSPKMQAVKHSPKMQPVSHSPKMQPRVEQKAQAEPLHVQPLTLEILQQQIKDLQARVAELENRV